MHEKQEAGIKAGHVCRQSEQVLRNRAEKMWRVVSVQYGQTAQETQ